MRGLSEPFHLVTLSTKSNEDLVILLTVEDRSPAQDPEVVATRVSNHCERVVIRQVNNPVIAPEWTEETHFEFSMGNRIDNTSKAFYRVLIACERVFAAAVHDIDIAVGA